MADTRTGAPTASEEPDAGRRLPEHVTTPLLTLITTRSMDEDYAHVAQKRALAGDERPRATRPHWSSFLAVAALGVMAAVVAVQTDREAPANELSRAALVQQIDTRSDNVRALQADVARLTRFNASVASNSTRTQADLGDAETRVRRAELTTGFSAVHGPGVRITVDNRPGDEVDGAT